MMNTVEKLKYQMPFTERYFDARRYGKVAQYAGEVATTEAIGLEARFDVEIESGFSEALSGRVAADYSFGVVDGKIVADDGEPLEVSMLRARRHAYEIAADNPEMSFIIDRFEAELEELHAQQAIIAGAVDYNALLTLSPMTFELRHRPDLLSRGYQRPDLDRSLARLSVWDGRVMHIVTRSLDNSTLQLVKQSATKATGHSFKAETSLGVLSERLPLVLTRVDALKLIDDMVVQYDDLIYAQTGKKTRQGAETSHDKDLLEFVRGHPEILSNVKKEVAKFLPLCRNYIDFKMKLERCLYNHMALYKQLLDGEGYSPDDISGQASGAGTEAAQSGVVFSMCGELISADNRTQLSEMTGFDSLMRYSNKKVQCPNSKCKKMVVVEDKYLRDGILHCSACKHTLDVCGDKSKAQRIKDRAIKKAIKAEEKSIKRAKRILSNKKNWWS